jgi:uncharacterized protein (TIGR02147 family)
VIDGKRNLGLESVPKFCKGLGLSSREAKYFLALVQFNQSRSSSEKNELYRALLSFSEKRKSWALGEAQHRLYSHWHYPAIQEMVLLKGFPGEAAERAPWLHERLGGKVTLRQIEQALEDLQALGMLRTDPGGRLAQATPFYASSDGTLDFALQAFHRRMIEAALAAIDQPLEARDVSGVTLALRREDLPVAIAAIREFRKKFNFDFSADQDADEVWELNLQFFRLARSQVPGRATQSPTLDKEQT